MKTVRDIVQFISAVPEHIPDLCMDAQVTSASPLSDAGAGDVTFCTRAGPDCAWPYLPTTRAALLIMHESSMGSDSRRVIQAGVQTVIYSPNPRLDFIRVLNKFLLPEPPRSFATGSGSVIYPGVRIYDGVRIGDNVTIHSGCVIGADGFGFERNENGELEKFPSLGGVIIEDDVEIMALTHVARGALGDTVVGKGTKIDALVHVAHNVKIGEHCLIVAHAVLLGSVTIGDRVYIGPGAVIRDGVTVGDDAFVGFGSIVTKDVPAGATVMGSPARGMEEQKRLLREFGRMAKGGKECI